MTSLDPPRPTGTVVVRCGRCHLHPESKAAVEDRHADFQVAPGRVKVKVEGADGGKNTVHTHVLCMPERTVEPNHGQRKVQQFCELCVCF